MMFPALSEEDKAAMRDMAINQGKTFLAYVALLRVVCHLNPFRVSAFIGRLDSEWCALVKLFMRQNQKISRRFKGGFRDLF